MFPPPPVHTHTTTPPAPTTTIEHVAHRHVYVVYSLSYICCERELLMLDPVPLPQLERVEVELGRELVHDPLDGEGRLGRAGPPVA